MVLFWDTSALTKRYFTEDGSAHVAALLAGEDNTHIASRLTLAEVPSAIVRQVPDTSVADKLLARFQRDMEILFSLSSFDDALVDEAANLVRRHRLRGCDSLQLAAALRVAIEVPSLIFLSADIELNAAAASEKLSVIDPNRR